jgi:hypothetical protein
VEAAVSVGVERATPLVLGSTFSVDQPPPRVLRDKVSMYSLLAHTESVRDNNRQN